MEDIIFCFLSAACGAVFTSIGCRCAYVRHRRPGWHLVVVGVLVATFLTMLYAGGADLFRPERWHDYKSPTSAA